ncbi:uncharacterized protein LOC142986750 [Anticarsia gemmatalis]|uniref:uncharacterized protein LOC142986750 n=1 Tax=Anticarsia gemmatalis TaxID=129554 RepID=UPI003F770E4F
MPPKEAPKKPQPTVVRLPISDSSLVYVPEDVIEGFQERLETGIDWTLLELGIRYHKRRTTKREEIPTMPFSEALENKIKKSVLDGFLDENSTLTLDEQWELILATTMWDNEMFASDEGKICFHNDNCVTNDMLKLIRKAVQTGDRRVLRKELKLVEVLKINDEKMTELDQGILEFKRLVSLNLCGNYIKDIDPDLIPQTLRSLELQANHIIDISAFAEFLPQDLLYLGLARNLLKGDIRLSQLPYYLSVLDLSDNDLYHLDPILDALITLPNLISLYLAGNPCSVCAGYARNILMRLRRLKWLDSREIHASDRSPASETFEMHPDDLRSTYFNFTVFRVMSAAQPPKPEKGAVTAFHVELEIPLLDVDRRRFLMFRRNESLTEMLPPPEDDELEPQPQASSAIPGQSRALLGTLDEASSHASDIYNHLVSKSSREIIHFTVFESNKVQWAKVMNFLEPTVKIFCPDLVALRNTFKSVITVRLVYSVVNPKPAKADKKSMHALKVPPEQRVVLATIKCALRNPDWSQQSQHFHWDDSLGTNDAIHWGDGDLAVLQYSQAPVKVTKGKTEADTVASSRQSPPDNLTCHFGFGIDTLRVVQ